jgi:hypothetical protein
LQEEEACSKEAETTQAHNQMPGVKRGDAGLCFANVDSTISSRAITQKEIPRDIDAMNK